MSRVNVSKTNKIEMPLKIVPVCFLYAIKIKKPIMFHKLKILTKPQSSIYMVNVIHNANINQIK